uniref:RNA polymerase III subunit Rpc25 domain-containing protein n=1 Tax=Plectus sambesii TaxID=2011161 RepID=A0A914UHT1_9BILA
MFVLAQMTDTVRVAPHEFGSDFQTALEKVVLNVGLCICFYDFIEIADSYLLPGDGASHTNVVFRFVVFRPFVDEILTGKIQACTRQSITLSVGFFDNIIVPADKLPTVSRFDDKEQVWYWEYASDDGEAPAKLYMDPGKEVRFRVVEEQFCETQPTTADQTPIEQQQSGEGADRKSPYTIIVSMSESGLGDLQWWVTAPAEDEPMDAGGEED